MRHHRVRARTSAQTAFPRTLTRAQFAERMSEVRRDPDAETAPRAKFLRSCASCGAQLVESSRDCAAWKPCPVCKGE